MARFIEGLRQANGIIAGITQMPWATFLAYNCLGAALWVGLWTTLGYIAGDHLTAIYERAHRYQIYLAIAVALGLLALLGRWLWHRRQHHNR